ncbi:MAG: hypothetical protein LUG54_04170 [Clostridiales bacterium]|nr:hypothetical protein [Clostridiales bacterium]
MKKVLWLFYRRSFEFLLIYKGFLPFFTKGQAMPGGAQILLAACWGIPKPLRTSPLVMGDALLFHALNTDTEKENSNGPLYRISQETNRNIITR